jgi:membrane protease YdiL (CAAX protease family)
MYCGQCGARLPDYAIYCGNCGARRTQGGPADAMAAAAPPPFGSLAPAGGDASFAGDPNAPPFAGGRIDWTLLDVLFGVLWFLGLFLLIPIPIVLPFLAFGEDSTEYYAAALIAGAGSELGLIATAAWFSFRKYGGSWPRLGFRAPEWSTLAYALGAVVAAFLLAAIYGALIEVFDIDWLRSERDDQIPNEVLDSALLLVIAGIVTIGFAPVCEEIFFRGFIMPGMLRAWGVGAAVVVSGLVFSAAHIGPNIHKTLVPIFIIGAVFAFTYYRSGNILSTILAHLIFNAISFAGLAFSDPDDADAIAAVLSAVAAR